jgi:uncharacterized membrane protein YdjX (TVP38/TMEM64 family)
MPLVGDGPAWRRFGLLTATVAAALLALFLLFRAAGVGDRLEPAAWDAGAGAMAAALSLALLLADVVLPVPASLVMVGNGALFGLWGGAGLSLLGGWGSSLLAFALGRRLPAAWAGAETGTTEHAGTWFDRWGLAAVVLSRPLPLVSETVAVVAGAARCDGRTFALASLLGAAPAALVYAWIGAWARGGAPLLPLLAAYAIIGGACLLLGRRSAAGRAAEPGSRRSD